MRNENGEVHTETDEARGGSTPHIVRWILVISTLAAIVLLSAVWIFGAWSQGDIEEEANATRIEQDREEGSGTDTMLSDGFDEFAPDTAADVADEADAARAIPNQTE